MSISEGGGSDGQSRIAQWLSETLNGRNGSRSSRANSSKKRRFAGDKQDDGAGDHTNEFATDDLVTHDHSLHAPIVTAPVAAALASSSAAHSAEAAASPSPQSPIAGPDDSGSDPLTPVSDPSAPLASPLSSTTMSLTASVSGSSTSASPQPSGLNVSPCCGTCGYVNCPLQAMAQGGTTKLSGELYGTGSPGIPDAKTTGTAKMGASVSDSMSSAVVMSAADWTIAPVIVQATLPGGGEVGVAAIKPAGVLSGAVTNPPVVQPQVQGRAAALAAPNVNALAITNPIVLENMKQGNPESEWGIDGAGSDNIEGFATDISVNHGTTVSFKINTDSNNYRIDIYRLGYYGGMGARKVDTIMHTGVQIQPDPLRDANTGLVDAGNWAVSATWDVPADAVSGVYIAKLTRLDGVAGENQIPFIVRDDSSTSDIVFQTSDETWQAYNGWGGANLYGGDGPATGQGAGRAYAVSYNRPITTRGGTSTGTYAGPQDYLFGAEYAAISWLEQNGYDVSYMAGVDVDRYGSLLLNHKVYMDAGHDEYWSGQQRANVEAARDAGVNLQFWSGNEVYWRTRWGNSISSDATAYRTLISYKETWANAPIDPTDQWTGTFRDPRFSPPAVGGGSPENSLTGTLFKVDDVGNNLGAIQIPYDDANLRFWRNTSVANLQPGQTATLTQNYLGYEWDEAPDNGFDPAGLVRLSSTTLPVNTYLLDYGNTVGNAEATHSLTLYRAPSGALVFGAGTVYWSWGVSDNHDLTPTPTDPRVQQAMVNLFADMGVQPGTLQSGLITGQASTDHVAPTSAINTPPTTGTVGTSVTITGTAVDSGGGVIAGVEVSTDNGASWHPATGDETWSYTFTPTIIGNYTILSRAVDDSINLETPSAGRTMTIQGANYLSLFPASATPAVVNTADAGAVELGVRFQSSISGTISGIRFYKSTLDTGVHTGTLWSSAGVALATVTFNNETATGWQSATFSTPITITPGVVYTASYHTTVGLYSSSQNYFTANVTSGPLTAPAANNGVFVYGNGNVAPTETFQSTNFWVDVMFNPSNGTANLPPVAVDDPGKTTTANTQLAIATSTLLANDSDPNGDTLTVTGVSGATHGTVALNSQTNTIFFTPDAGYTGAASFTYTISDGRGSSASANVGINVTAQPTGFSFFTAANTPAEIGLNDGQPLDVGMKFTSSTAGQITALKFYRSSTDTGPDLLSLWSSTGVKLGSVTFTNTSATGWQTVVLPTPISISANTTYVASYHTNGIYAATGNYFTSTITSGPLTATSTGNGVYSYGGDSTNGIFPTNSFGASNYWVDVIFSGPGANTTPTAVADAGDATEKGGVANGSGGSNATGNVLTNDTDPDAGDTKTVTAISFGATTGTLGTALAGAYGSLVISAAGVFTYTINETAAAVQALRTSTNTLTDVFTYTMRDTAGATSTATLTVTVHGANDAPVLAAQTANQNAVVGSAFSLVLPATTFTDVDTGDTLTYSVTLADGSALPSWLTFNPTTRTFSGTPAAANVGTLNIRATATDLGALAASETFTITVAAPSAPPTAVADTADATEKGGVANGSGGSNATGNVLTNDTDPDAGDTKTVTAISFGSTAGTLGAALNGAYGSLVISAAGVFTYTINETAAAVQALRTSTNTLTEVFTYTMRDTTGSTSSATLTITLHGANDAPVLAAQTAAQNALVGTAFSLVLPATTFTDVDTGDTLTYSVTLADGSALPAWLTFNPTTRTFSGTPAAANVGTLSVRVTATDLGSLTATETFSIAVASNAPPVSFFTTANTPAQTSLNDGQALELGMKFTSSTAGTITALKFYRSASDTGPDLLSLWTSTGTKLGSVTFSNTTATGWQTVTLATPINISANTTYVASYHTNGAYVATSNYFTSAIASGPLTATASANGVYSYGGNATNGIFPTSTFGASNYWVDVVFTASTGGGGSNTAPTAVADTADATEKGGIANGSGGSAATGNVLTNDTDPDAGDTKTVTAISFGSTAGTLGAALNGARGSLTINASGVFTYTINENDAAVQALRLSTNTLTDVFNYTMRDTAGATSTATLTITIHGANDAPTLSAQTADQNAVVGSAFSLALPANTFADVDTGDTLTYSATLADGSALPSWLAFNATTRTFSGTPAAANVGTLSVRATATDLGGLAASETFNIAVTSAPQQPTTVSLFSAANTPTLTSLNDGTQLELGMKFTSSTAGQITALKFYRSPSDTGNDLLSLWSSTGTKLASVTFSNTTATGWQTVALSSPVNINANTTYVVSYHTNGAYVASNNGFTNAVTSGPLTAPSSASSGGNGLYAYGGDGTNGLFPTSSFSASNYYADVVFRPQLAA